MGLVIQDGALEDVGKIRGWLLLPALGLILGIGRELVELIGIVRVVQRGLSIEGIVGLLFGMAWLIFVVTIAIFFFTKHRWAPWLYMVMLAANVVVVGLSLLMILLAGESIVEGTIQLMRGSVTAAIWIPYFIRSRRVKLTFVNRWRRRPELSVG